MEIKTPVDVEKFIYSLEKDTIAKILRVLDLLEEFGPSLGMPHSKKVTRGLFELRIHGKQEVRLLYCLRQGSAVVLHGFIKKTQRTPTKEIRAALRKMEELDRE